jgi:hypothetical protein
MVRTVVQRVVLARALGAQDVEHHLRDPFPQSSIEYCVVGVANELHEETAMPVCRLRGGEWRSR